MSLEDMIEDRRVMREEVALISQAIKDEKSKIAFKARETASKEAPAFIRLQGEVALLRRMIAVLLREDTRSFAKLGDEMGVSGQTARTLFLDGVSRLKKMEAGNENI